LSKVLLIDDHPVVRKGVARILSAALPGVTLGEADNAGQGLTQLRTAQWDAIVLDLTLPDHPGMVLLRQLRRKHPDIPVIVLTMHAADQFARRALQAGAVAYITKGSDPSELVVAVKTVLSGERPALPAFEPAREGKTRPIHEKLSDREYQVFRMIGTGRTVSQIATELNLSVKTVSTYRSRILEKMQMHTNAELMRYAIEHKLVG
jgi:two-component system invasion response regulator UvrY